VVCAALGGWRQGLTGRDIAKAKKIAGELEESAMAKTKPFDAAAYLDSREAIAAY
jgi:hypothetical protein